MSISRKWGRGWISFRLNPTHRCSNVALRDKRKKTLYSKMAPSLTYPHAYISTILFPFLGLNPGSFSLAKCVAACLEVLSSRRIVYVVQEQWLHAKNWEKKLYQNKKCIIKCKSALSLKAKMWEISCLLSATIPEPQHSKHVSSFYSKGHFVAKAWEALVEGTLSLGSHWENKNLLTDRGEGTFIFPAKYQHLRTNVLAEIHPIQRKYLK